MSSRIYYLRDNKNRVKRANGSLTRGNPKVCIVSDYDPATHLVKYGLASLSLSEEGATSKALARVLATWRLNNRAHRTMVKMVGETPTSNEIHRAICLRLRHHANEEIHKLSRRWLRDQKKAEAKALMITGTQQKPEIIKTEPQIKTGPILRLVEELDSTPEAVEVAIRA